MSARRATASEVRAQVRASLRDRVDGESVLDRIEGCVEMLLSGHEPIKDAVTHTTTYVPLDGPRVQALKVVLDVQLRLLSKVLPDLKAVEMSGPDGERLPAGSGDRLVLATKLLAIMREQQGVLLAPELPDWLA